MTRIIAGALRGRRLRVPAQGVRPTSDRVREAVFSHLSHEVAGWDGLRVLDLFAGTGALALEAVSRGAAHALMVEADSRVLPVLRSNVSLVAGEADADIRVRASRAEALATRPCPGPPYDIVFLDPPYDVPHETVRDILADLCGSGWIAPHGIVVVESAGRAREVPWPECITAVDSREYGDTRIWYGLAGVSDSPTEEDDVWPPQSARDPSTR